MNHELPKYQGTLLGIPFFSDTEFPKQTPEEEAEQRLPASAFGAWMDRHMANAQRLLAAAVTSNPGGRWAFVFEGELHSGALSVASLDPGWEPPAESALTGG